MGIGTRGGFYDGVGTLRDMVQNHLAQLLAVTAMEPPAAFDASGFRNEVVKVYQSLTPLTGEDIRHSVIGKFWLQIDKDEQYKRFKEREQNPNKEWKITDEDWRNREKWDAYEAAVNEMLVRTSTDYAPWTIVEGNNKYYARLKVLKTVIEMFEKRLKD